MTWNRQEYHDETRRYMDAVRSKRWDDIQVNRMLGLVHWGEWKRLMEKSPGIRTDVLTGVVRDSEGKVALSALTTGTGNATKTFYKVQAVGIGGVVLDEMTPGDIMFPAGQHIIRRGWWIESDSLYVVPAGTEAVDVRLQRLPQRMDLLTTGTDPVEWPDGHEMLLVHEAAVLLLPKGGAEFDFAMATMEVAKEERRLLAQEMWRRGFKPVEFKYADDASAWTPNF